MQDAVTALNDSPKQPDGTSAMFVRILDKAGVRSCVDKLVELNPMAHAVVDYDSATVKVYAPDGDLVFGALPTDDRKQHFLCRLHKEVFSQEV